MVESMFIINQVLHLIPTGPVHTQDFKYFGNPRIKMKSSMEYLINHFKLYSEHYSIGASDIYQAVEAPKGEFGIYLVTDNTNHPMRCKIKAPGFLSLTGVEWHVPQSLISGPGNYYWNARYSIWGN